MCKLFNSGIEEREKKEMLQAEEVEKSSATSMIRNVPLIIHATANALLGRHRETVLEHGTHSTLPSTKEPPGCTR